jgi:hypothetical protein
MRFILDDHNNRMGEYEEDEPQLLLGLLQITALFWGLLLGLLRLGGKSDSEEPIKRAHGTGNQKSFTRLENGYTLWHRFDAL